MKKYLLVAAAAAALLFAGESLTYAQFSDPRARNEAVTYSRGHLYNSAGEVITSSDAARYFGREITEETFIGASKQYKIGRSLTIAGAITLPAGLATAVVGSIIYNEEDEDLGAAIAFLGGFTAGAGFELLSVGIPFMSIGRSRLEWIEQDHNSSIRSPRRPVSFTFTATSHGPGLALRF